MKPSTRTLIASTAAFFAISASPQASATVIVSETFGGLVGDPLNGTSADTFAAGIASADGSATWAASADYKADGSVTTRRTSASLNLGSYVNDAKGTATGKFTLQATVALPTSPTSTWVSLGFAAENTPATTKTFNDQGIKDAPGTTTGYANMIYRTNGDIDQYAGSGSTNPVAADDALFSGVRTLTITLDFTPAGGYNGTDNFGTAHFGADTGLGGAYEEYGSFTYTSDAPIGSILLGGFGDLNISSQTITTIYGDLTLSQITESPPQLLGFTYDSVTGNSLVSIKGLANTTYKLVEASNLDFSSPDQDPVPLTGAGVGTLSGDMVMTTAAGDATVSFNLGTAESATFVRAEEVP